MMYTLIVVSLYARDTDEYRSSEMEDHKAYSIINVNK